MLILKFCRLIFMLSEGQYVGIPAFLKPFKFGRSKTPKCASFQILILGFVKVDLEKTLLFGEVLFHNVAFFMFPCPMPEVLMRW